MCNDRSNCQNCGRCSRRAVLTATMSAALLGPTTLRLRRVSAASADVPDDGFVAIPANPAFTFLRAPGSTENGTGESAPIDQPYALAITPVTNSEYTAFLTASPDHPLPSAWTGGTFPAGKDDHPVQWVSSNDAVAYCDWLSAQNPDWAFRLPTEAEWEYAAQALIGTQWLEEMQTHQRIYPWDGHALRNPFGKQMGFFLANFKRGRGDYAGIAGRLNDGALITSYIYEFPPNDYGLYNMAGNVSEWVMDVYRPLSYQDFDDLNPIRRDGFLDDQKYYNSDIEKNPQGFTSLITDKARVYKGGSWKDVAYWMSPGTRRFLDQDSATATIGFRCAMIRAGSNY